MNKIIYTVNAYHSIVGWNLQYFINRLYIWPHSKKMYPKFTCSCHVEVSTVNKHVFCSNVYIPPPIRILLSKHFLVHRFDKRNTPWFFKGTTIFAITLHECIFYSGGSYFFCLYQQKITCSIGMSNFLTGFFFCQ